MFVFSGPWVSDCVQWTRLVVQNQKFEKEHRVQVQSEPLGYYFRERYTVNLAKLASFIFIKFANLLILY